MARLTRACYKRLMALGNENLAHEIFSAPAEPAKQINLYAMMRQNLLVREFMIDLVGEKHRLRDYALTRKDINAFFAHLQEQNDCVAGWSDNTLIKIKQVLTKCLVETQTLDSFRATILNPVYIAPEPERGIRENGDLEALVAYNCFS